jgi:hypothetical protein
MKRRQKDAVPQIDPAHARLAFVCSEDASGFGTQGNSSDRKIARRPAARFLGAGAGATGESNTNSLLTGKFSRVQIRRSRKQLETAEDFPPRRPEQGISPLKTVLRHTEQGISRIALAVSLLRTLPSHPADRSHGSDVSILFQSGAISRLIARQTHG